MNYQKKELDLIKPDINFNETTNINLKKNS